MNTASCTDQNLEALLKSANRHTDEDLKQSTPNYWIQTNVLNIMFQIFRGVALKEALKIIPVSMSNHLLMTGFPSPHNPQSDNCAWT